MFKLLIVDDEEWIRERLRTTVDWKGMGIEVVGEAKDGEEALELTEKLLPEIVVTDIRMPCIDGLEFITKMRERNLAVKVIIISGYSDFEYAQKAIKLGAFDYILKPVEDEDLTDVIKRCTEDMETERKKDLLFKKAKLQIQESLPVLREKFFMNLVNGFYSSEKEALEALSELGTKCLEHRGICFIARLDEFSADDTGLKWDKNLVQFVVCNIIQDFLTKLGSSELIYSQTGEVICLVFSDKDGDVLTRQVLSVSNGIRKMIKKIIGCSATMGIGRVSETLLGIAASCNEAREALQYRIYLGGDRIYDIRGINTAHRPNYYKANNLEILLNSIKTGNKESALSSLDRMIKEAHSGHGNVHPIDLKLLFMDIINAVFKTVLDSNSPLSDFSEFSYKFFKQLNMLQTVDETYCWLSDTIVKIIDMLEKYNSSKKRKIISAALDYIDKHYTEPITLNDMADRLYMNPSYFCKVFREEMGEPFTKYLISLRVQKAKELMADPKMRIYEIAGLVGYDDVQYFNRIFKAILGVTPMQYREKIK